MIRSKWTNVFALKPNPSNSWQTALYDFYALFNFISHFTPASTS
jgi:hypothetical protein